ARHRELPRPLPRHAGDAPARAHGPAPRGRAALLLAEGRAAQAASRGRRGARRATADGRRGVFARATRLGPRLLAGVDRRPPEGSGQAGGVLPWTEPPRLVPLEGVAAVPEEGASLRSLVD